MSTASPFNLTETPLIRGASLIEASAGTGKTYAITALFVRLIVEENLSVREILAVTYTEAATEELRHRVRQALVQAWQAFASGETESVSNICSSRPLRVLVVPSPLNSDFPSARAISSSRKIS